MLGFILSKMNLLILVVAIFVIVAFFMFSLADVARIHEAQLMLDRLAKKTSAIVVSQTYCDSTSYVLPSAIRVTGRDFFYVMTVSKVQLETEDGDTINYLIYSVFQRAEFFRPTEPKAIAADSFRTPAEINIFTINEASGLPEPLPEDEPYALLDPQARTPVDALMLVKEVRAGDPYLYVIPCASDRFVCEANKEYVAKNYLEGEREEFNC